METLEQTLSLSDLNDLIRKSFGKRCGCNYTLRLDVPINARGYFEVNHPAQIAEIGLFERGLGWIGDENIQGPKDGSVITVFPKYAKKARKYALLYKERTGRDASVRITTRE